MNTHSFICIEGPFFMFVDSIFEVFGFALDLITLSDTAFYSLIM